MLNAERIDYMIGYPWEIHYLSGQLANKVDIATIDIKELEGKQWIMPYIGCTKNKWGHRMIKKLNEILIRVRPNRDYIHHLIKWLPDNMKPKVVKAYKEHVLTVTN